jgi:hypothetical protein
MEPDENSGPALLDMIAVANLAAIRSRAWSYGWRVGHLIKAIEPAIAANDLQASRDHSDEDPGVARFFSLKHRSQYMDTTAAAIVVLVHSFFDAAVTELLVTCILHDESRWRDRIISEWKKQYSLREMFSSDPAAIYQQASDHYLNTIGNKSLVKRHQQLLDVIATSGPIGTSPMSENIEVIRRVDEARNRFVHDNGLIGPRYTRAIDDGGALIVYSHDLVTATAASLGLSEIEVTAQMSVLSLEGVATPLLPEHLEGL